MEVDDYFLGFAKISLDALWYDHPLARRFYERRERQVLGAKDLEKVFATKGCEKNLEKHAIKAVINISALDEILQDQNIPSLPQTLGRGIDAPFLDVGRVKALDGRRRTLAAKNFFRDRIDNRWWTVKLYSSGKLFLQANDKYPDRRSSSQRYNPRYNE
jgi:hypothetical protein